MKKAYEVPYEVGVIAGSFDIIHPGYIRLIRDAKNQCRTLIVLLNADPQSTPERPKFPCVLSVEEREEILWNIKGVDAVSVYHSEEELREILGWMHPDVRILGSDYKDQPITGADLGIPIYYHERKHDWSETKIKNLIHETLRERMR